MAMKKSVVLGLLLAVVLGMVQGIGAQVNQEWVARFNGPANGSDCAISTVVDGEGNVYVTGYTAGQMGSIDYNDYITIKYNSSGEQQWTAIYNGPENGTDWATKVAVDGSGNVFVTGYSKGTGSYYNNDYATIKYNNTGQQQWVARYNGPANNDDGATDLVVDAVGNIIVTGYSYGIGIYHDFATIKYDSAGQQLWVVRYNGPGNGHDYARSLGVDANDNIYVTGESWGTGTSYDYATIKYNSAGQQQWLARWQPNSTDYPERLAVDSDGNLYVAGSSFTTDTTTHYVTLKYNAAGQQQWVAFYNYVPENYSHDIAYSVTPDNRGNVYVTGRSSSLLLYPYNYNYATIKYNSIGRQQWVARYGGSGNGSSQAKSLAVDGESCIYVTGESLSDFATVKYDSSGSQTWEMRYNYGGMDGATCLAIDDSDDILVAGFSWGNGTAHDLTTIKYSQSSLNLDITLTPLNPPIIVPANGGSFNFNVSVVNNGPGQAPFAVWAMIKNPDGSYTPPTIGPVTINPPVGLTVTRQRTQNVPGSWVAGVYTYLGYVNTTYAYPAIDSSSFTFTKSATADGGIWVTEATCTGELFQGEDNPQQTVGHPAVGHQASQPSAFSLLEVSPNPFNPSTALSFKLQAASFVSLKVYDTAGRVVSTLLDGWTQAGTHEATFDGSKLAAGVYLVRLEAGKDVQVEKIVLLK